MADPDPPADPRSCDRWLDSSRNCPEFTAAMERNSVYIDRHWADAQQIASLRAELDLLRQALRQLAQQWQEEAAALLHVYEFDQGMRYWRGAAPEADLGKKCADQLLARLRERST